jgi:hypothetical protein
MTWCEAEDKSLRKTEPSGGTGRGEDRTGDERNFRLNRRDSESSKPMDDTTKDYWATTKPDTRSDRSRTPMPRRTGSTHPDRITTYAEHGNPVEVCRATGSKPDARKAELLSGNRKA